MLAASSFDYAVIRVVPRVERAEFINAGIIVYCRMQRYLGAEIDLDRALLSAMAPAAALEVIESHLAQILAICLGGPQGGPIGALSQAERFHWLVAPRSTVIQASPVHCGICMEPERALRHLTDSMVRRLSE